MDVISFPLWRVYCFLEDDNQNTIRRWMEREDIPEWKGAVLRERIRLLEAGGPDCSPGLIVPVDSMFYILNVKVRKGELPMTPVFCYGPFFDQEITILTGAPIENGILKAKDVLPIARRNLETLMDNSARRIRERIDRRSAY